MGTWALGHSAILLASRDLTWDAFGGPAVSPGSSGHTQLPHPAPGVWRGWHPRPGDTAGHCHTPRVDNIQMPARPGYESARTGAQRPRQDNRSCPGGGSGQIPCGQQRLPGPAATSRSAPGTANPWPGILFPRCQAVARWHRARAVPNLDPGSWRAAGRARLSPRAPSHRHVPAGQPEHSSRESLSLTGYLKAHLCPLSPSCLGWKSPVPSRDSERAFPGSGQQFTGEGRDGYPRPAAKDQALSWGQTPGKVPWPSRLAAGLGAQQSPAQPWAPRGWRSHKNSFPSSC